uniref:Retrotransposon protein, putative, Ty1-copia subclass n=1 Tax=Tanacetum cinerariifolium TaxID=118510 RepID=A0A6L2KR41_TANCI|nr:retrotransposon protein, putative, Ty1-copia subclass [Tanacetum cinerariifolium]
MASFLSPELQKTFENTWANEMNQQLKEMFQAKASKECLDVVKSLIHGKLKPRASICAFVVDMKGYVDRLESLNMMFDGELSINIIQSGHPSYYNQFVLSYQMNRKKTSIMELHSLLETAEQGINKIDVSSTSPAPVLTVGHNAKKRNTSHSNLKGNASQGKSNRGSKRKAASEIAPTSNPKEAVCFYCNTKGHWKAIQKVSKQSREPTRQKDKEDKISDSTLSELDELANYKEAMAIPEAAKWKEAMKNEIQSMYENQIDVKTTFLNQNLTGDVFMVQPKGFENAKYPKRVCKLQKAIYGLKQDSRSWNLCLHEKVTQFGFSRSEDESYIYVKVSGSVVVFLILYVDDILLIGNNIPTLQSVKDQLGKYFAMKDLVDSAYILGIKIYRDSWQTDKDDSRLQSGWVFLLNRGAVTWKSSKQDRMADFTCQSKYIVICEASKEAIWIKNFIRDLGVVLTVQDPIEIIYDNESAIALTKEPKDYKKSNHIERKYHFVRSKVEEGHVIVKDI